MQDTAGEVGTSSLVMYSYGPLHIDKKASTILHTPALLGYGVFRPGDPPEAMNDREGWQ